MGLYKSRQGLHSRERSQVGGFLPSATLKLKLGPKAKDFVKIVGKGEKYKRGSVSFKATRDTIEIKVEANDPVALLASVSSAIKQLKVIGDVDSLMS